MTFQGLLVGGNYCCLVAQSCPTLYHLMNYSPLSMGFSQQEYWSGLPFPPPGDFPDPGVEPASPALAGVFFTSEPPGKPRITVGSCFFPGLSNACSASERERGLGRGTLSPGSDISEGSASCPVV